MTEPSITFLHSLYITNDVIQKIDEIGALFDPQHDPSILSNAIKHSRVHFIAILHTQSNHPNNSSSLPKNILGFCTFFQTFHSFILENLTISERFNGNICILLKESIQYILVLQQKPVILFLDHTQPSFSNMVTVYSEQKITHHNDRIPLFQYHIKTRDNYRVIPNTNTPWTYGNNYKHAFITNPLLLSTSSSSSSSSTTPLSTSVQIHFDTNPAKQPNTSSSRKSVHHKKRKLVQQQPLITKNTSSPSSSSSLASTNTIPEPQCLSPNKRTSRNKT